MSIKLLQDKIDNINLKLGRSVSWLSLIIVLLMSFNVLARYAFKLNLIWQQELILFMHSVIFLAGAGYTLLHNKHVRVDVIYCHLSEKHKAMIDIAGTILFLFPFCFSISYFSYDFIINSWNIMEKSPEYNGIYGIFILKSFIWIFTFSLTLQGISTIISSIIKIRGDA